MTMIRVVREYPKPPVKHVELTISEEQAQLIWAYLYRTGGTGKWWKIGEELKSRLAQYGLVRPLGWGPAGVYDDVFEGETCLYTRYAE